MFTHQVEIEMRNSLSSTLSIVPLVFALVFLLMLISPVPAKPLVWSGAVDNPETASGRTNPSAPAALKRAAPSTRRVSQAASPQGQASPAASQSPVPAETNQATPALANKNETGSLSLKIFLAPLIPTVAFMLTIVGIVLTRRWYYSKRSFDARKDFEALFTRLEEKPLPANREELVDYFFSGADLNANAHNYVRLGLPARRERLMARAQAVLLNEKSELCIIQTVGDRQQGKTLYLAQLGREFAAERAREVWSAKLSKATEVLKRPDVIRQYFKNHHLNWIGSPSAPRKRLTLMIDDVVEPNQITGYGSDLEAGIDFISDLDGLPITIFTASVSPVFPESLPTVHSIKGFKLKSEDLAPILDKWIEYERLDQERATRLIDNARLKALYGRQLFAFLSVVFENSDFRTKRSRHLAKFDDDYERSSNPHLNILPIAACQLLEVAFPYRLLQQLDPGFKLNYSFITLKPYEHDSEDRVYECGGTFLPRWLLKNKLGRTRFDQLRGVYMVLFDSIPTIPSFGQFQSEREFILKLLLRLATGAIPGSFDGNSATEASALLDGHKTLIDGCLSNIGNDIPSLLDWARVYTKLHRWKDAVPLFDRAFDELERNVDENIIHTFRIVAAVIDSPDMKLLGRAAVVLPQFMALVIENPQLGKSLAPKVLHVYTDYLSRLKGPAKAAEVLQKYLEPEGRVKPDGLLYMRLGQLLEAAANNWADAQQAYERAANAESPWPETALRCKQRYAVFLSRHHLANAPDPDILFQSALSFGTEKGLEVAPTRVAWAQHKISLAWRSGTTDGRSQYVGEAKVLLDDALADYRERFIVEPHAWQVMVMLIGDWTEYLHEAPDKLYQQAELLCREVTENRFIPWRSRLMANHMLGRMIGFSTYTFQGRQRPDCAESLSTLRSSFESPGSQRTDRSGKTFQDALTHRAIKDIYERVLRETRPDARKLAHSRERKRLKREEFHGRCAFEGLAPVNGPIPGWRVREHILGTRDWFAYFLWNVKCPAFPEFSADILDEAERLYCQNVSDLTDWGWAASAEKQRDVWPHAFEIYLHFSLFLCLYRSGYRYGSENANMNQAALDLIKQQVGSLILALPHSYPRLIRGRQETNQLRKLLRYLHTYWRCTSDREFDNLECELKNVLHGLGTAPTLRQRSRG